MLTLLYFALGWSGLVFAILAVTGNITWPLGAVIKYDPEQGRAFDPRARMAVTYLGPVPEQSDRQRFRFEHHGASHEFETGPSRFGELYELTAEVDRRLSRRPKEDGPERSLALDPAFLDFSALPVHRRDFSRRLFVRLLKEAFPPGSRWKSVSVDLISPGAKPELYPSHAVKRFRRRRFPKDEPRAYEPPPNQIPLNREDIRALRQAFRQPLPPIQYDPAAQRAFDPATGMAVRHVRDGYIREGDDYYALEFNGRSAEFDAGIGHDSKLSAASRQLDPSIRYHTYRYRQHRQHRLTTSVFAFQDLPNALKDKAVRRFADLFRVCAGHRTRATTWVWTFGQVPERFMVHEDVPDIDMADFARWLDREAATQASRTG